MPALRKAMSRWGCLTWLAITFGACGLIFLLVNPWSLRMGSRWTPFIWHGYGRLQSTTGADYILYLRLMPHMDVSEGSSDTSNLSGSAALCTPQRTIHDFEVGGAVKAWLNADRKRMRLNLGTPDGVKPSLAFRLNGNWEGQELVLEDSGSLAESFHEDGTAKGYMVGKSAGKESATAKLAYGSYEAFEAACRGR